MPASLKTFRVFISSTFSDMQLERRILQEKVFPRLQALCESHGATFQAIDLRWGVSEETQFDHKTMDLCLSEITRCQKISPRPNFIILLGDRYGWQPIPARIPSDEMSSILDSVTSETRNLLEFWYKEDLNAVPPEYVLLPREGEYCSFDRWIEAEDLLRCVLRHTVATLSFTQDQQVKYFASATHQEIIRGALNTPPSVYLPEEHVFVYVRTIRNLPGTSETRNFIDLAKEAHDPYSKEQLSSLVHELRGKLSPNHVYDYQGIWDEGLVLDNSNAFGERVYTDLEKILEEELKEIALLTPLEREVQLHKELKDLLINHFTGRVESLAGIAEYLCSPSLKPYCIIGTTGSGKTSLMAQAIDDAGGGTGKIIYRFIGTSAYSSSLNHLLFSLIEEITTVYGVDQSSLLREVEDESKLSNEFGLSQMFQRSLELASEDKPLIVFLDALDQLATNVNTVSLNWLPTQLPSNVRFIVSALPELQEDLEKITDVNELPLMPIGDGTVLLDKWLNTLKRTIQPQQRNRINECFSKNGSPLYLKLAFEQVKEWHSYSTYSTLADTTKGMLTDYFDDLEQKHGGLFVSKVCAYLLSGRYQGLSERDLLGLMIFDQEYWKHFLESSHPDHRNEVEKIGKLPVIIWSRLFLDLEPFLSEKEAGSVSIISFYHRSFVEFARKRYNCNPDQNHATLANFFALEPLFLDEKEQIPNMRKVFEQPYQQTMARKWDDLVDKSLASLEFLKAKCKAGLVYDLMSDFATAEFSLPNQKERREKEAEKQNIIKAYIPNLIEYSKKSEFTSMPIPPDVLEISNLESTLQGCKKWSTLEKLQAWRHFVGTHIRQLADGEEPIFQMAWNSANEGPVAELVAELDEKGGGISAEWLRQKNRPTFFLSPSCIKVMEMHTGQVSNLSTTPDFRMVITGSDDKTLRLWDLETGECLKTLSGHFDHVLAVSISPDGSRAISGSRDGTIYFWNLENGSRIYEPKMHSGSVYSVSIGVDGRLAASGSYDKTIRIWDFEQGECLNVLKGHAGPVNSVSITTDGLRVLSGSEDGTLRLWDIVSGECLMIYNNTYKRPVNAVSITPNGKFAISSSYGGSINLWNLENGERLMFCRTEMDAASSVAITHDGRRAMSTYYNNTICLWNLENGERLKVLRGHTGPVNTVSISLDGGLAISGGKDRSLRVWDLVNGISVKEQKQHQKPVSSVSFTPVGNKVVSGSWDETLKVWDEKDGKCSMTLKKHWGKIDSLILAVSITPDGRRVLSSSNDNTIRLWNLESKKYVTVIDNRILKSAATTVAVTPDGWKAITGSKDRVIRVWDLESCTFVTALKGHTHKIKSVAITPDGRQIVSGSTDNTIRTWNLNGGKCLKLLEGHLMPVSSVAITPDGKHVVSGGKDKKVRIWDLESGECLNVFDGHLGPVSSVSITPDGKRVVSGGKDKKVRIWDLESGKCIAMCEMDSMVFSVVAHCTGLAVGGSSGRVNFYAIENFCLGSPIITAVRQRLIDQQIWDSKLTALCPWCGNHFDIDHLFDTSSLDYRRKVINIQTSHQLRQNEINCPFPNCGKILKLNPFVCDNSFKIKHLNKLIQQR